MNIGRLLGTIAKFALNKVVVPILKERAVAEAEKAVAKRDRRSED